MCLTDIVLHNASRSTLSQLTLFDVEDGIQTGYLQCVFIEAGERVDQVGASLGLDVSRPETHRFRPVDSPRSQVADNLITWRPDSQMGFGHLTHELTLQSPEVAATDVLNLNSDLINGCNVIVSCTLDTIVIYYACNHSSVAFYQIDSKYFNLCSKC